MLRVVPDCSSHTFSSLFKLFYLDLEALEENYQLGGCFGSHTFENRRKFHKKGEIRSASTVLSSFRQESVTKSTFSLLSHLIKSPRAHRLYCIIFSFNDAPLAFLMYYCEKRLALGPSGGGVRLRDKRQTDAQSNRKDNGSFKNDNRIHLLEERTYKCDSSDGNRRDRLKQ